MKFKLIFFIAFVLIANDMRSQDPKGKKASDSVYVFPNAISANCENVTVCGGLFLSVDAAASGTTIFNRWGKKVFESKMAKKKTTDKKIWDTKDQEGKLCPEGTYFYLVRVLTHTGKVYDLKGNVTVFRNG